MSSRSRANPWWGPRRAPETPEPISPFFRAVEDIAPIPVRTDLTVLSADDPKQKSIGWMMTERSGVEVYRLDDDFRCGVRKNTITVEGDLKPGDEIAVPALMGNYHGMKVERDASGVLSARGESLAATLEFTKDDRQCWVAIAIFNLRAVTKLTKEITAR